MNNFLKGYSLFTLFQYVEPDQIWGTKIHLVCAKELGRGVLEFFSTHTENLFPAKQDSNYLFLSEQSLPLPQEICFRFLNCLIGKNISHSYSGEADHIMTEELKYNGCNVIRHVHWYSLLRRYMTFNRNQCSCLIRLVLLCIHHLRSVLITLECYINIML